MFRTIREQIADRIRADVLSGRIERGTSLPEVSLAKQFGVSRAPIRDALLQLTQEGLLEAKPNCGVRVGDSADQQLQPLVVALRKRIEEFALREFFHKLTPQKLAQLDETIEQLRIACEAEDLGDVAYYDMAFHRHLVEAADSSELIAIWLPIVSRMMLHYSRHCDMIESYREHSEIVQAIRAGDEQAAVEALLSNIQ